MNNEEVISHHGILGQRWGIRRFQNPDGSLTAAGRRRAQKLKGEYKALTGKKLKGKIPKEEPHKRKITELNATELKTRLERSKNIVTTLDNEANSYTSFKNTVKRKVIIPAAIDAGKNVLQNFIEASLYKMLKIDPKNKTFLKEAVEETKKETDKVITQATNDVQKKSLLSKAIDYGKAKSEQKAANAARKQAKEATAAWERQQKANREAWEHQQEENRRTWKETINNMYGKNNTSPSNSESYRSTKSNIKEAVYGRDYVDTEPAKLSYKERLSLPYKKK